MRMFSCSILAGGRFANAARSALGWPERNSGATCLRESDRDRLLGGFRAVLAFADVVHLFAYEFSGGGRARLALPKVALGLLDRLAFWHVASADVVVHEAYPMHF
jgi:hypothetical protein